MFHASLTPKDRLEELLGTETIATLREVVLMHRDLGPVVPAAKPGDDVVVLVHGFFASAGVFRPMRARLERELACRVASFTYVSGLPVKRVAAQLADVVARVPGGTRVHVVGHSLGGVVARWYVQELGGWRRVVQTVSLASPFGGAPLAHRFPVAVGADLKAGSLTLGRVRGRAHVGSVPHTSIVAGDDRVVVGHHRAAFYHGDVHVLPGRGHNTLLYDEEAIRLVVAAIRRSRSASASALDNAAQ